MPFRIFGKVPSCSSIGRQADKRVPPLYCPSLKTKFILEQAASQQQLDAAYCYRRGSVVNLCVCVFVCL